ncbi:hypothetical protein E4U19_001297 [Claviceps sp. Clav32 group G5]|nr:hypothetical protein E4U19_001297 [Claviceps sp. Clav32 group G5]
MTSIDADLLAGPSHLTVQLKGAGSGEASYGCSAMEALVVAGHDTWALSEVIDCGNQHRRNEYQSHYLVLISFNTSRSGVLLSNARGLTRARPLTPRYRKSLRPAVGVCQGRNDNVNCRHVHLDP